MGLRHRKRADPASGKTAALETSVTGGGRTPGVREGGSAKIQPDYCVDPRAVEGRVVRLEQQRRRLRVRRRVLDTRALKRGQALATTGRARSKCRLSRPQNMWRGGINDRLDLSRLACFNAAESTACSEAAMAIITGVERA